MTITCVFCGNAKFSGGDIELNQQGGYDVIMICAGCGAHQAVMVSNDPEFAKMLIGFFSGSSQ
jgi:transcription elongation factor Elf1